MPKARRSSAPIIPTWRPRTYSPIKLDDQGTYYTVPPSLFPNAALDVIARQLAEQAQVLILQVQDTAPRVRDRRTLQQILQGVGLPSDILRNGLQALSWIVDERVWQAKPTLMA